MNSTRSKKQQRSSVQSHSTSTNNCQNSVNNNNTSTRNPSSISRTLDTVNGNHQCSNLQNHTNNNNGSKNHSVTSKNHGTTISHGGGHPTTNSKNHNLPTTSQQNHTNNVSQNCTTNNHHQNPTTGFHNHVSTNTSHNHGGPTSKCPTTTTSRYPDPSPLRCRFPSVNNNSGPLEIYKGRMNPQKSSFGGATKEQSRLPVVQKKSCQGGRRPSVFLTDTETTHRVIGQEPVVVQHHEDNKDQFTAHALGNPLSQTRGLHPSSLHHEYLLNEINLLQSQPVWAITKAKSKPDIPVPQLPPMVDLLHSSHAVLIQRLIQAYAQIGNIRNDEENTFGTRTNTPTQSFTKLPVTTSKILNRETELELGNEYLIVRTKLPVPKGQELSVESYYSLNQTIPRQDLVAPTKSSCTILSDTEFQKLLYDKTCADKHNQNEQQQGSIVSSSTFNNQIDKSNHSVMSEDSLDEQDDSALTSYYEAIFIKKTERKMLLYINPKVMFDPGMRAADGSFVPYPSHQTYTKMSQIYVSCFDRSKTDFELKEIFKDNPPISHKIYRKLPRAERGSSVPCLDSYYGTDDIENVGHASYFIPMLTTDERTAIGWKSKYTYGKWKYSVQKISSVLSTNNVKRTSTTTHIGPEIHPDPVRPPALYKGNSFTSTKKESLGNSMRLDPNGLFGCFQCIFPYIFKKQDDDEPDLIENWMEDTNSKKSKKRRRRRRKAKRYSAEGGDIVDVDTSSVSVPSDIRHLPPPIMIPVLGDENTWFFDKPPPPDYNADMFLHTYNKDFGKPYKKDVSTEAQDELPQKPKSKGIQTGSSKNPFKWFFKIE